MAVSSSERCCRGSTGPCCNYYSKVGQCLLLFSLMFFNTLDLAESRKDSCRNTYGDDAKCDLWTREGQCEITEWMLDNCERSCGLCIVDKDENAKFQRILDEFYDYRSREFPEYATYVGYHDHDDALESFSLSAFDRRKNETNTYINRIKALNTGQLSKVNKREVRILSSYLQTFVDGYQWRDYGALNSINFLEGLAKGPQWPLYARLETEHDFQDYLKRLASFPDQTPTTFHLVVSYEMLEYRANLPSWNTVLPLAHQIHGLLKPRSLCSQINKINEQISLMKRAITLKRSSHMVSVNRVPSMLSEWDVEMFFFMPFQNSLAKKGFTSTIKVRMWEKARTLIPQVSQAVNRLKKFIDKDYFDATRDQPGVHSLPQGVEYYEACLKWYLGYDVTANEVFKLGVEEVARIEKKIKEVMASVGFDGDLKSFFKFVENIPKFYNHTKEQILEKYRTMLDDQIIPRLESMFYNVSIAPITIVPVERDGPWGSYGLSMFYVNLKEPMKRSTFTMMPLTLHEAYPGHHFQDLYSQHFDIPLYRAQPLNGRLYSVPFHFPVYSAYAEGWALYAEFLGHELGLYQEPFDLFGRYVSEIFRACRLVVDTGIHAFGWSRERAIEFLSGYSDFPLSQVAAEVDRYITAPGQACAYKIGEINIKKLREKAEKSLGPLFDLKEFHHQILKVGYVPLNILEEVVDDWIKSKLTSDSSVTSDYFSDLTSPKGGQPILITPWFLIVFCIVFLYAEVENIR